MYQRLMVRVSPEQWILRTIHSNDVINVSIADRAHLTTSTGTDTWHTEVLLSILLPLISIATLRSCGSGITWTLRAWQCWLHRTLRTASTCTNQYPWMPSAWTLRLMRHSLPTDQVSRSIKPGETEPLDTQRLDIEHVRGPGSEQLSHPRDDQYNSLGKLQQLGIPRHDVGTR